MQEENKIEQEERKFTKEDLAKHSLELFSKERFIIDGALFDVKDDELLTIEEVKQKIETWLKKEVV